MARLESQAKLLYYPTSDAVAQTAASWFSIKLGIHPIRIFDPCCGTGRAVRLFADSLGKVETLGIELSHFRAIEAQKTLDRVLPTDFYPVAKYYWSEKSASLILNNPPYDWSDKKDEEGKRIRHELLFVQHCNRKLVTGGHQVIIIPRAMMANDKLLRQLLLWYAEIKVFGYQDTAFKQLVIMALGKLEKANQSAVTKENMDALRLFADEAAPVEDLPEGQGQYVLPAAPAAFKFSYIPRSGADMLRAIQKANPLHTGEYRRASYVRPIGAPISPAMPFVVGHITLLLSGQEAGVLELNDPQKGRFLVKGLAKKSKKASQEERVSSDDRGNINTTYTITTREKFTSTIAQVFGDGAAKLLEKGEEVGQFTEDFAQPLAAAVLGKNLPVYNMNPTPAEIESIAGLGEGLPPLPGRKERGLFPMQKHWALAAARVMRQSGHAILNLEMGTGKTITTIAALTALDKWPAIVLCPGHMTGKWKRDIERGAAPDKPIVARIITKPARAEATRWSAIEKQIEAMNCVIEETSRDQIAPQSLNDPGMRRKVRVSIPNKAFAGEVIKILSQNFTDKDANGKAISIPAKVKLNGGVVTAEYVERDDYTVGDFVADTKAGRLGQRAVAVIAFDPAKYDAGINNRAVYTHHQLLTNDEGEKHHVKVSACPVCGKAYQDSTPDFCTCGAALFEFSRFRRTGMARLVQRKYKQIFKVYVADEVHKAKEGRTDIGVADQRFLSSTKYSIALTGTLFGGVASSLFYLLYRRSPELRRLFAFNEVTRWVDQYGLWEESWNQGEPIQEGGRGVFTNIKRWNLRRKELPGVSPAVIRYLLPVTMFGNITDLGYKLPPIHEKIVPISMDKLQAAQNMATTSALLDAALRLARKGDAGALSVWFNTALHRPASGFRDEVVTYKDKLEMFLPQVIGPGGWLPKERALAEIILGNMLKGRKTLVFVEQTGERDIRSRLKDVIEVLVMALAQENNEILPHAPHAGVLSASDMSPAKRESWIAFNAPKMDALLVNPKLVETGLDLVMFSDIVFYECTTSLYVLWQSMCRVWRLGQTVPVWTYFLVYRDCVEADINIRMGRKMKAAQLLYGKEASGVLVEEDDDDIRRAVIRAAFRGEVAECAAELDQMAGGIFSTGTESEMMVSNDPAGSLIAASPRAIIHQVQQLDWMTGVPVMQLSIFGDAVPVQVKNSGSTKSRKKAQPVALMGFDFGQG